MEIEIAHYIAEPREYERFQIHVLADVDLAGFSIADEHGNSFQFEKQTVKAGDKIILQKNQGTSFSIPPEDDDDHQETIYTYYWGIGGVEWDPETDNISVLRDGVAESELLENLLYTAPDHF